jgi:hypothetical protein
MGGVPAAPFNQFSHARALAGPADTFVTINNDTLYSMAQLDLSAGPVEMDVPDTGDRYLCSGRSPPSDAACWPGPGASSS